MLIPLALQIAMCGMYLFAYTPVVKLMVTQLPEDTSSFWSLTRAALFSTQQAGGSPPGTPWLYGMLHDIAFLTLANLTTETLKKQASQNYKEYDRLATELNTLSGTKSDKRRD